MRRIAPSWAHDITHVLCIGAHADDIEIGCAGTLLELRAANPDIMFDWVVLSGEGERAQETRAAARRLLGPHHKVRVADFTDRYFPARYADLKRYVAGLGRTLSPDVVFCPRRVDAHQDHRTVAELTWQTFRNHLVLEYEIVKWEGDLGQPNAYVALSNDTAAEKLATLADEFPTQRDHDWFDDEVFRGLLRLRGVECRAPSGYAEAFHATKLRLW